MSNYVFDIKDIEIVKDEHCPPDTFLLVADRQSIYRKADGRAVKITWTEAGHYTIEPL